MSIFRIALCLHICIFYSAYGQDGEYVYVRLGENVTMICPFRDSSGVINLYWQGPPYTGLTRVTYINSVDGVNPNTVLGNRLSMTGDHLSGEYNMVITNTQASDAAAYICEFGNQRKYFYLRLLVAVSSVTINPLTITATEGGVNQQLTCTSSDSSPPASVYWYLVRQGTSTPMNITNGVSNTQQGNKTVSTFSYSGQRVDNGGNIYCTATNGWGKKHIQSESASVKVYYKPTNVQITPSYNPYIVYVGQSGVQLSCAATPGNPPDTSYRWTYNGIDRVGSTYPVIVTRRSAGTYKCTARNTAGSSSATVNMQVQYAPEIQPFTKQQPKEGDMFSLTCVITSANPNPTSQQIWWTRQSDGNFRQNGNQLVLDNIQRTQADTYICHAINTVTPSGQSDITLADTDNVVIDVLYKASIVISPAFNPLFIYVGQPNVQLSCGTSDANPPSVTYRWTHSGTTRNNALYDLTPVSTGSGGNYICYGRNTAGTSSSAITVNVQYGPIIESISNRRFIAGKDYTIECKVTAEPQASVLWSGPNNLQQNTNVLQLNGITKSNNGSYTCQASNTLAPSGQSSVSKTERVSVHVVVLYKPEVSPITSPSVVEGETLNISCTASANPPVSSYIWTKLDEPGFRSSSSNLVIPRINKTNTGTYRCTATNTMDPTGGLTELGNGYAYVRINVKYQPSIQSLGLIGNGVERNEGDYTSIECMVDSYPVADITWRTNTGNNRPTYYKNSTTTSSYNFTAECLDTGNYTCTANNGIGQTALSQLSVFVRCSPRIDKRYPYTGPKISIKKGDTFNITTAYLAYPSANVTSTLYRNSSDTIQSLVDSENGLSIMNKGFVYWQTSQLLKRNTIKDDYGIYTVTLRNDISSTSASYIVEARGTPDAPILVSVVCLNHKEANITWNPQYNGGSVQHFNIQYRKNNDNSYTYWRHNITNTKLRITETVDGLIETTTYHFRIAAVNIYGDTLSTTEYSCNTLANKATSSSDSSSIVGAVAGTLGIGVGIAVASISFLLWRRRNRLNQLQQTDDKLARNEISLSPTYDEIQSSRPNNPDDSTRTTNYEDLLASNRNNSQTATTNENTYEALNSPKPNNIYESKTGGDGNDRNKTRAYTNIQLDDSIGGHPGLSDEAHVLRDPVYANTKIS